MTIKYQEEIAKKRAIEEKIKKVMADIQSTDVPNELLELMREHARLVEELIKI